ncbi:MAG TPA: hypothetical protein DCL35_06050 [Candidatus Omnitrophica bacterium]|nr:hypothetical protein [Candidatus Omnitrophota bacterium]
MHDLWDRIKNACSVHSGRTAIQQRQGAGWMSVGYLELISEIETLAVYLSDEGVGKGDRVALMLENRYEWPLVFFSVLCAGAIAVPIDPESSPTEIEGVLDDSRAKILFASGSTVKKAQQVRRPVIKKLVCVDTPEFKDLLKFGNRGNFLEAVIAPGDIAVISYTSGTTGIHKGVMLSHGNILANCDSLLEFGIVSESDSIVSALPLHHTYPLTITMITPLLAGCKIIYPGSIRGEAVLKAMRELDPTIFVAVPQVLYSMHKRITDEFEKIPFPFSFIFKAFIGSLYAFRRATGLNLSKSVFFWLHSRFGARLRFFVSGGARLDEAVENMFFKLGFTIVEGYGLTETSPVLTLNPISRPKIGSVGRPIPRVELKIDAPDEFGIGEVAARGPNVMAGYYKREDLTRDAIRDGWFYTGDLGYFDKEGYLFLTGRSKDVIVLSSGQNVYPEEVEDAYLKAAPVKEMCVFEAPAAEGSRERDVLWAVVVPDLEYFKKYGEVNLESVIKERFDNVSRAMPAHKRLMGFHITLEELPHTQLGKIKRFEVKDKYLPKIISRHLRAAEVQGPSEEDAAMLESEVGSKISVYLKEHTSLDRDILPSDLLELDLGIDSLGRIEIAAGLEHLFQVPVKDEVIGGAFTVRDLIIGIEGMLREGKAAGQEVNTYDIVPRSWKGLLQAAPKKDNLAKLDLAPGAGVWVMAFLVTSFLRLFFRLLYNLKVEGNENFPKGGPYILYANHSSYFDAFLIVSSLASFTRLDLFFMGFRPYFAVPVIRSLVKVGRIIPIDFAAHFLEALKSAYFVLARGKNLCLFPEGIRSLDGEIHAFKKGFGILAKETGAKLIPVILEGAYEAWPRTAKLPRMHPIRVRFGKTLSPDEAEAIGVKEGAKESYEAICIGARKALLELGKEIRPT